MGVYINNPSLLDTYSLHSSHRTLFPATFSGPSPSRIETICLVLSPSCTGVVAIETAGTARTAHSPIRTPIVSSRPPLFVVLPTFFSYRPCFSRLAAVRVPAAPHSSRSPSQSNDRDGCLVYPPLAATQSHRRVSIRIRHICREESSFLIYIYIHRLREPISILMSIRLDRSHGGVSRN